MEVRGWQIEVRVWSIEVRGWPTEVRVAGFCLRKWMIIPLAQNNGMMAHPSSYFNRMNFNFPKSSYSGVPPVFSLFHFS